MTMPPSATPPGWYPAQGDPPGTVRWWDGSGWRGGPVPGDAYGYGIGQPIARHRDSLPELGRVLASPWSRIGAAILDALILAVPAIVLAFLILDIDTEDSVVTGEISSDSAVLSVAALVIGLAYHVGFVATRGATPGKMAVGLRIIATDGTPLGWGKATLRYLPRAIGIVPIVGGLISLVIEVVSLVLLFTDRRRQTIWDRAAGSYVVDASG